MTLNAIKHKLIAFYKSHGMLNTVLYGDDFDFNAERNIVYPVVNIEYNDTSVGNRTMQHSFIVTIADLMDENIDGHEDEIFSDTVMIAEDFFAWLDNQEGFDFNRSARLNKFSDDTHDRTAGVTFNIALSVVRADNDCYIPKKNPPVIVFGFIQDEDGNNILDEMGNPLMEEF